MTKLLGTNQIALESQSFVSLAQALTDQGLMVRWPSTGATGATEAPGAPSSYSPPHPPKSDQATLVAWSKATLNLLFCFFLSLGPVFEKGLFKACLAL